MYRRDFWTLWEKARVGWSERTASKHVYYQVWNRSPVQVGCMRQVLGAGALGWPRGMGWGGRWEGCSGWGTHVNPWLIHVNVWQKPLQYCNYPPTNKNNCGKKVVVIWHWKWFSVCFIIYKVITQKTVCHCLNIPYFSSLLFLAVLSVFAWNVFLHF